MKFSIITPSFNRPDFLNTTIKSVVEQEGDFEIEYIIQDGGSSEETINLIKKWSGYINKGANLYCNKVDFQWFKEPDTGMYDAILKGFNRSNGDILSWINTDDFYLPGAFATISQIFDEYKDIKWLSGIQSQSNKYNAIVNSIGQNKPYLREYIKKGFYQKKYTKYGFRWIQQDCVFWHRSLWNRINTKVIIDKKYAGDYYLWREFAQYSDLATVQSFFSSYRFHGDQITNTPELYMSEIADEIQKPPKGLIIYNILSSCISSFPNIQLQLTARYEYIYKLLIKLLGLDWRILKGPKIHWCNEEQKWILETNY